jgi:hypothetical protein
MLTGKHPSGIASKLNIFTITDIRLGGHEYNFSFLF